ncbi:MAG: hypothetical protein U1F43_09770 [Myxococcota bacterium]
MSRLLVVIAPVLALNLTLGSQTACGAPERLTASQEEVLALREVSGLARGRVGGAEVLLAIGDEARAVTVIPIVKDLPDVAAARSVAVALPVVKGGSQLEGVAIDARGHVWLLSEGEAPSLTEVVLDGDSASVVQRGELVVPAGHPLEIAWARDANARGEGLVVQEGRVLIAKQKDPTAIVAFTPSGDHWVAGTYWTVVALDDLSDLAVGPDGAIFAIGARSERICRLAPLTPGGGEVRCEQHWTLPATLGNGSPHWEGLAFMDDGRPVVAVDRKKSDSPNFALLPLLK